MDAWNIMYHYDRLVDNEYTDDHSPLAAESWVP